MRNLNECQAEVFRRSEKRIKERKQRRNRILTVCVPTALCLTLICVLALPGLSQEKAADSAAPPSLQESAMGTVPPQDLPEFLSGPIEKITVYGPDFSQTYTEFSQVLSISNQLKTYSSATGQELRSESCKENSLTGIADQSEAEYTIFLITEEDNTVKFLFSGNTLKNPATNEIYTLSQQQVAELNHLLGIPQS